MADRGEAAGGSAIAQQSDQDQHIADESERERQSVGDGRRIECAIVGPRATRHFQVSHVEIVVDLQSGAI